MVSYLALGYPAPASCCHFSALLRPHYSPSSSFSCSFPRLVVGTPRLGFSEQIAYICSFSSKIYSEHKSRSMFGYPLPEMNEYVVVAGSQPLQKSFQARILTLLLSKRRWHPELLFFVHLHSLNTYVYLEETWLAENSLKFHDWLHILCRLYLLRFFLLSAKKNFPKCFQESAPVFDFHSINMCHFLISTREFISGILINKTASSFARQI